MSLPFNRDVLLAWLWDAGERALKTGLQVFLATAGTAATFNQVAWTTLLPMVVYAMLLSFVTSALSARTGETGTASLVGTTPIGKHHVKDDGA